MKKVNKVSIAGVAFSLDEDAYMALAEYMDILHAAYDRNPDGKEIIADIEARIAELILSEQVCLKVVPKTLIDSIIAQLGMPENENGEDSSTSLSSDGDVSIPRRLYRSSYDSKLGGIFSGMSQFWNIDVVWFRCIFFIPLIVTIVATVCDWEALSVFAGSVFGVFIMIYMVLWFAIPMAKTPRQKLEMRGQRITASSIHQNFQSTAQSPSSRKAASVMAEVLYVIGRVAIFAIRVVGAALGFVAGITAAAVIALSLSAFVVLGWTYSSVIFALIAILFLIPQVVLCYVLLCFAFDWRVKGKGILASIFIWIIMLIMSICVSVLWTPRIVKDADAISERIERLMSADDLSEAVDLFFNMGSGVSSLTIRSSSVDEHSADTVRTTVKILKIDKENDTLICE